MIAHVEIFLAGAWHRAAVLEAGGDVERGFRGRSHLSYDFDYAATSASALGARDWRAVSCRYPITFNLHSEATWPAFLLDILPSGAGRRTAVNQLGLRDGPGADWPLLLQAQHPAGHLRIAPATPGDTTPEHAGFPYEDVVARGEHFIEYAYQHGAPVAGSSGALGDAPKFFLTQDHAGRWHADGTLPDARAAKHWLVKFPRGKAASDRAVLRNEAAYVAVAKALGLRVFDLPRFDSDALFVPRFDRRVTGNGVHRHGQETLCSLAGIADYGVRVSHQTLCAAIAQHCSDVATDLQEYLWRDVFNVAMGNVDNHARNTSVSKFDDGVVALSPIYDFAPMILDDEGIARACRWEGCEALGMPDWGAVAEDLARFGMEATLLRHALADLAATTERLPDILHTAHVDDDLITRLGGTIGEVTAALRSARPHGGRP